MSEERMDVSKLRAFVLEEALAGAGVYIADGERVEGFHLFRGASPYCLGGVVSAVLHVWTREGSYNLPGAGASGLDLRLGPKTRTVWINLWESLEQRTIAAGSHETREEALADHPGGDWRLLETFSHTFEVAR